MSDEIRISVSFPLDSDGFLRRECPNCEREFKWFSHAEGDAAAAQATQYFCPLCGAAADLDEWNTSPQNAALLGAAGPHLDRLFSDTVSDAFKGIKGIEFKSNSDFTLGMPDTEPLHEPDDMVIVEPPCHPNEPLKIPEQDSASVHCLVCGSQFSS